MNYRRFDANASYKRVVRHQMDEIIRMEIRGEHFDLLRFPHLATGLEFALENGFLQKNPKCSGQNVDHNGLSVAGFLYYQNVLKPWIERAENIALILGGIGIIISLFHR